MKRIACKKALLLMVCFTMLTLSLTTLPIATSVNASGTAAYASVYICPKIWAPQAPGEILTVEVKVANVSSLQGFELKLGYDTSALNFLDVVEGSFLGSFGTTITVKSEVNETFGFVWLAFALLGATPAVGDGTLATISFESTGLAESAFDLYDTILVDSGACPRDHYVTDGYSENEFVDPPPDPLYAGGSYPGVVYKHVAGQAWETISPVLGDIVLSLVEYDEHLYAGVTADGVGRVYRYDGDSTWALVGDNMDHGVDSMAVYQGQLYAGTEWNGMKLYRYEGVGNWMQVIDPIMWSGTAALYVSQGWLLMGDVGFDRFGRWDGSTFYPDQDGGGSCIYDYQDFEGYVYAAAWMGRLWRSSNAISWDVVLGYYGVTMWEVERFQGLLYMAYDNGELRASTGVARGSFVYQAPGSIKSMTVDASNLYFGTEGTANVYRYDGINVELISGVDEFGGGVEVLYTGVFPSPPPDGHDVAVTSVLPYQSSVVQGESLLINASVENQGDFAETFDLTVYHGNPFLTPAQWQAFWRIGDVSRDGYIDDVDVARVVAAYCSSPPSDPDADLDGDGHVSIFDVVTVASNYGLDIWTYFNVSGDFIETQIVTNLNPGDPTTLTFIWDTTGVALGEYTLSAYAEPVLGETDKEDNTHIDGVITICPLTAAINLDPDTLNSASNGQWITAYITFPEEYSVEDIDITTVELRYYDFASLAEWGEVQDGVLMMKFDRVLLRDYLGVVDVDGGDKFYDITLKVTGELVTGTPFEGVDTITIKRR